MRCSPYCLGRRAILRTLELFARRAAALVGRHFQNLFLLVRCADALEAVFGPYLEEKERLEASAKDAWARRRADYRAMHRRAARDCLSVLEEVAGPVPRGCKEPLLRHFTDTYGQGGKMTLPESIGNGKARERYLKWANKGGE